MIQWDLDPRCDDGGLKSDEVAVFFFFSFSRFIFSFFLLLAISITMPGSRQPLIAFLDC